MGSITIQLDKDLERRLAELSRRTGRTRADIVREALRRQLTSQIFVELRGQAAPFATAAGYLTDEDVFCEIS